jgi:hypothetical protein
MATWIFEPGHTGAEFRARHMMVTWVRGMFKNIHGKLEFDPDHWLDATFKGEIDAVGIWTGEAGRDAHLRSADFFDSRALPEDQLHRSFRGAHGQHDLQGRGGAGGGIVVGNQIDVILDVEAILLADLQRTGAIEYYQD